VVLLAAGCLQRNTWICGEYLSTRRSDILTAVEHHVALTIESVVAGLVLAFALVLLVRGSRTGRATLVTVTSAVYTIPSLALFAVLVPWTGLSENTVRIGLVLYSLVILVRSLLAGLDGVPEDVVEAAQGMGFGRVRLLRSVELPLALPTVMGGIRLATVSTIALVTIGAVIGEGGLGNLLFDSLQSDFKAEALTAAVLCVVIAVIADLALIGLQRLLTPWRTGSSS
jgi:osmoprotectant transport system permease protein